MPEIPEITCRANEMNKELSGKKIAAFESLQPKCLNLPASDFSKSVANAVIESVLNRGKWILVQTNKGWVLINLGMGGEILYTSRQKMPAKYQLVFDFDDHTCLTIHFWWFGYVHYCSIEALASHAILAKLGPNILDVSKEEFSCLLKGQKGRIKAFMLDQSKFAGIGNAYIHDILFLARLHPLRLIPSLTESEINNLYQAIQEGLRPSLAKGGAFYELDIYGQKGGFTMDDILIGYKENSACPRCTSQIIKIKTGATHSFICPQCQPLG